MTDHPLALPAVRVRALLAGRMTQIRLPAWKMDCGNRVQWAPTRWQRVKAGDRLWVRESFSYDRLDIDKDGIPPPWYWADGNPEFGDWTKPKPSIHMPRWASRLTLIVTAVKQEPLHSISEEDARAEGVESFIDGGKRFWKRYRDGGWNTYVDNPIGSFASLWTELHGPGAWERNEEVCAISFVRHHANIDASEAA